MLLLRKNKVNPDESSAFFTCYESEVSSVQVKTSNFGPKIEARLTHPYSTAPTKKDMGVGRTN